jgi:hypothetical protein
MKRLCISAWVILLTLFVLVPFASSEGPVGKNFKSGSLNEWTEIDPELVDPDFEYNGLKPACASCPPTRNPYTEATRSYDPRFTFFVKKGKTKNLVVYFQGGGACWDSLNCLYFHTYYEEVPPIGMFHDTEGRGIFDQTNEENPFKDWSIVYIPYCTGDIHWGANDKVYDAIAPYASLLAEEGTSFTIKHRGFVNFQFVLKWIKDNYDKPPKIFVTGSSAGSYGAIMGFPYIKEAFPWSHISVLGDAGNGIVSDGFVNNSLANWGIQDNLPDWIPGFERPFTELTMADIYKMIAAYYPHSKVGQYTAAWDWNQTFFYSVMLDIDSPLPNPAIWGEAWFWAQAWNDWHDKMLEFAYQTAEAPNYRYYIGPGTSHTIMMSPLFYTDVSAGVPFKDWIEAMVGNQGGTKGRGAMPWMNVECVECLP